RLGQRSLERVVIRVRYQRRSVSLDRPFYIDLARDRRGALRGGTLYWAPASGSVNRLSLASELASYLGEDDQSETLALLLADAEDLLEREHVSEVELRAAAGALARAKRRVRAEDVAEELEPASDLLAGTASPE